jgi:predicted nucleotidyltransferase
MRKHIPEEIKPILEEVKERLEKIYGPRLKGIILYGSYARGDANDESDIDLLILLDDVENPVDEREKYFKKIHEIDLKYDTLVSTIPMDYQEYSERKSPIIMNVRREGIAL